MVWESDDILEVMRVRDSIGAEVGSNIQAER